MEAEVTNVTEFSPMKLPVEDPQPIGAEDFSRITDAQKPDLLGGGHNGILNQKNIAAAAFACWDLGRAQAERDQRPVSDVVLVIAQNAPYERFFKIHDKLSDAERERMKEALTDEETTAYEILVETENLEKDPALKVYHRNTRIAYEREWATAHWRWKRYYAERCENPEAPWFAWWCYRDWFTTDPIYLDNRAPGNKAFRSMTELPVEQDAFKYLVIAGNSISAQVALLQPAKAEEIVDAAPVAGTADEYAASLREATESAKSPAQE